MEKPRFCVLMSNKAVFFPCSQREGMGILEICLSTYKAKCPKLKGQY